MATFHPAQPGSLGVTAGLSPQHIQPALLPTPWTLCGARPTPAAQAGQGETSQRLREGAELATTVAQGCEGPGGARLPSCSPSAAGGLPRTGLPPRAAAQGARGSFFSLERWDADRACPDTREGCDPQGVT